VEYIADWYCIDRDGNDFFVEAKGGFETDTWRLKRRLFMHSSIGVLEVWSGTAARPFLKEVIGGP
jgi:hypothetical protein